ncbi:MAG: hypothetical protein GY796_34815 [Chloroflexi bacterium]|nr:hypothetical protein [Chloroflexota bacterium]
MWNHLDHIERDVLRAADLLAAKGMAVEPGALSERIALSEEDLILALAKLEQRELLRFRGTPTTYEFIFDLLRLWIARRHRF